MGEDMGRAIVAGLGFGGFFFVNGIRLYLKKRLIENTPTSKIRGMAMGFVELYGKVVPETKTLISPFTGSKCVYYLYKIEEYRRSKNSSYWATIKTDTDDTVFFIDDGTGKVRVDPKTAKIDIPLDFRAQSLTNAPKTLKTFLDSGVIKTQGFLGFKKKLRFTEYYIAPDDKLYILGSATSRAGSRESVKNEDKIIITKGNFNKTFYISDSSETAILDNMRWKWSLSLFGGLALFLGALALLFSELGML